MKKYVLQILRTALTDEAVIDSLADRLQNLFTTNAQGVVLTDKALAKVISEVCAERDKAEKGGRSADTDDQVTLPGWHAAMRGIIDRLNPMLSYVNARIIFIEIAELAVAGAQSFDRQVAKIKEIKAPTNAYTLNEQNDVDVKQLKAAMEQLNETMKAFGARILAKMEGKI